MNLLSELTEQYLEYCQTQKRLDLKTLKAYRSDLKQFSAFMTDSGIEEFSSSLIESYIAALHQLYKPKTVRRKVASLKAFIHFLEFRRYLSSNPFSHVSCHFREPAVLPKTIPLYSIELLLYTVYHYQKTATTPLRRQRALRDAAVLELLFATGIRISELCALQSKNVDLVEGTILIFGKGAKERRIHVCNSDVLSILSRYASDFSSISNRSDHFFINHNGSGLSDQSVRRMIQKYCSMASIPQHITPHMFRHTFATSLLDAEVDIRFIQELLGHSSIHVTEIYTHVSIGKQKDILTHKHPRGRLNV